ncbi:MAG: hypothetical protein ACYC5M_03050 [Anaerolineae bacterium]
MFFAWAAILSLLFGIVFIGVTALTIGMWLAGQNAATTPVGDLSFFALGAVLIGVGLAAQLKAPERHIAGLQQALIGLLALSLGGWVGARVEPLTGGLLLLLAAAILAALHPARRALFRFGNGLNRPMAAMSILAAIPAAGYAAQMLAMARQAGASCFFGQCAYGDRFAEMAAAAVAIVLVAMLVAMKPPGWRVSAWCAGAAAIIMGLASIVLPEVPGTLGTVWGALATAWGAIFITVATWEARRRPAP